MVSWTVVIPVKLLALAKTRLSDLADADREAMALAMAADTVTAAVVCPPVGGVIVVSDDPDVAAGGRGRWARASSPTCLALASTEALAAGAEHATASWPGRGLAALTADLPALSAAELAIALTVASGVNQAFVADAAGVGHDLVHREAWGAVPAALRPAVAASSPGGRRGRARPARHPGLRRDVDTLADLCEAARIGLGRRSASMRRRSMRGAAS